MALEEIERQLRQVWPKIRRKHLYPALPDPILSDEGGTFISSISKKIYINHELVRFLAKRLELGDILEALLDHEVAHHCFCPWDFYTHLKLYTRARELVKDPLKAQVINDYFLDVVVNNYCVSQFSTPIPRLLRVLPKRPVEKLLCALHQQLWGIDLGVKKGEISKDDLEKLAHTSYLVREEWERGIKIFARILKRYVDQAPLLGAHEYRRHGREEIIKGLRRLALKTRDPKRFRSLLKELAQKEVLIEELLRLESRIIFYEALTAEIRLPVRDRVTESGGSLYPLSLTPWESSSPLEDLDWWNSYARLMPGITKLWHRAEGRSLDLSHNVPDCLIILDSSGSMPAPDHELSYPLLGAFCAANTYLTYGARVGVYNFGYACDGQEKLLDFTRDRLRIYKALAIYYGGCTEVDPHKLRQILSQARKPDVLMITDMDIYNLQETIGFFKTLSNRVTILHLKRNWSLTIFLRLFRHRSNFTSYQVLKREDIPKIVLGHIRRDLGL